MKERDLYKKCKNQNNNMIKKRIQRLITMMFTRMEFVSFNLDAPPTVLIPLDKDGDRIENNQLMKILALLLTANPNDFKVVMIDLFNEIHRDSTYSADPAFNTQTVRDFLCGRMGNRLNDFVRLLLRVVTKKFRFTINLIHKKADFNDAFTE